MLVKKSLYSYFFAIFGVLIMLILTNMASMQNVIFPFSIPIAIAFLSSGVKSYIVAPLFFIASLLNGINESNLIMSGYSSFMILLIGLFYLKAHINIKWWEGSIYVVICELAYLYFKVYLESEYLEGCLTVAVAVLTFITAKHIFKYIHKKPIVFKFSLEEKLSFCFVFLVMASGVANFVIPYINFYHFLGVLLILISAFTFSKNSTILFAVLYGLGNTLNTLEVGYVALFASIALCVVSFKADYKYYAVFIALIVDVVFGMYLYTGISYNLSSVVESLIACVVFCLIPLKYMKNISGYVSVGSQNVGIKAIINKDKKTMQNKLIELSNIFNEMDISFRKMIKGVLPLNDAKEMLANESCQKVCADCKNRAKCFRAKQNTMQVFYDLITVGFERGKVTLLDVPANVTTYCQKTSQILIVVNQLINQYKQYSNMITNLDSSRLLIADQLNGVSLIMKELSEKINEEIVFDNSKENKIIDELGFNDIICNGAVVYSKDNYTTNVSIIIRNQDIKNPTVKAVVSRVCGCILEIKDITESEISGWSTVTLSTMASYDIMFGYASVNKNGENISGDKYSILRLSDSKFLMAVCDGMGSGESASKTSELAISLVENFYKAGFDNEIILSSINKLLAIDNNENFTALDLCVLDLKNCFADFIKLGAPIGLIKHKDRTTSLKGGALPIGILEHIKPICYKTVLADQDMIVLSSDGVTEAFGTNENFESFVNNVNTVHPQELANKILEKALALNLGVANDDMTVVVGRIFEKVK